MMTKAKRNYPTLYQVNIRVWLNSISIKLCKRATLDDIPDHELDKIKEMGFEWVWLMGIWQTGSRGKEISRTNQDLLDEFERTLPDLKMGDIGGSGFAITSYEIHGDLGGNEALGRIKKKMKEKGLFLMLDFVPNHTAIDHQWVTTHPEFYIEGSRDDLQREPQNYISIPSKDKERIFAYGRDPFFSGWPDTLQLDYSNPELQKAMEIELGKVVKLCDGIHCDMAMLVIPSVFEKTWGKSCDSFWPKAIQKIKSKNPEFKFLAEVYWDLEWELQLQGFDYTYDKKLLDRLTEGKSQPIRDHLSAGLEYQGHTVRFLENHDEPRAASIFDQKKHEAAAIITYYSPGVRFFHQGQLEGKKTRISTHLIRGPHEPVDPVLHQFYLRLLQVLKNPLFEKGRWRLLDTKETWHGNSTWDSFVAFSWESSQNKMGVVVVNYAPYSGECFLELPLPYLTDKTWSLQNLMGDEIYVREGNSLLSEGLFLDMPAWHYHVFEFKQLKKEKK
ncbi:alpha-amylase family glycosyl hydrolase [Aquiflexum sp. TKW24L]|uniref:alpha-amylase family glycosyl hydrolase n=1 Tax=Aquiflexum sp. TKW24L TaxID=2942212 RepID=UPI0020BDB48C|nr:alpha-amylase family glycosyl hydrolase [Aquiflexum sp. TKW24L]MCL6258325.1 alpha-amylase family glycosyl hydrolase [Aquiflexum sp. TKW24L]